MTYEDYDLTFSPMFRSVATPLEAIARLLEAQTTATERIATAQEAQAKAAERQASALEAIALGIAGSFNPDSVGEKIDREFKPLQPLVWK